MSFLFIKEISIKMVFNFYNSFSLHLMSHFTSAINKRPRISVT